jgi:hypothetical protein
MTHVGDPGEDEINGNLIALNELAGIPLSSLKGFRAPFLNYSVDMLKRLAKAGFTYDSSATSSIPVTDPGTDAYWPYTLDNGLANDCLAVPNACKGQPQINGFWEFPMYALFDKRGPEGIHLMDPWLDTANGASVVDDSATLEYLKSTFTDHYNGKRQPFGLYTHPIHVAANYPGVPSPTSTIKMINQFLDWAQGQKDGIATPSIASTCTNISRSLDHQQRSAPPMDEEPHQDLGLEQLRRPQVHNPSSRRQDL